jgi:hypothetical protein
MSKTSHKVATLAVMALILPFAIGIVHAAEPAPNTDKQTSPPTIDTNNDGKADGWDRDANGLVDAWDTNGDKKPDLFDDNGDGKPDDAKAPSDKMEGEGEGQK